MAEIPPDAWRIMLKRRLAVTAAVLAAWAVGMEARLIYLQIVKRPALVARAEAQQSHTRNVPATRGQILDRRGHLLAVSLDAQTISANPREIGNPAQAVAAICAQLRDCSADERTQVTEKLSSRRVFAFVRRQVPREQAQRVAALKLEGLYFSAESRRFYPNRELAAHVLGHVNVDHDGLSGIEAAHDSLIRGRPGRVLVHTDAHRTAFSNRLEKAPTAGASLELTIDELIQYVVERELRAGVHENQAAGGSVVVMDPSSGEILALANYPTFNPNAMKQARADSRRNRAIQDVYEPGSTFKIVTAAAALEQGIVQADDLVDVSGGRIHFGSDVIRDTHDYKTLSFADVIVKSSNVGAIKVGLRLGADRLGEYIERFGFGRQSSPRDFPGESRGIVWHATRLPDSALARVSMGYQIAVTPLQMAVAVSSIANGGTLIQPRVVRAVIRDGVRRTVPKIVVNRTVSENVARDLTTIMEGVVERGTATLAQIPGYTIAGKTGTAAKLVDRRYSKTDYNASFVGFLPSRKPVYTVVVVIDSPHGANGYYGGQVAAPIFRRIAEALLQYGGVPPSLNPPPPVLVERRAESVREIPVSGRIASRALPAAGGDAVFPDVTGLSAREALTTLARIGMTPRMHGTGIVVDQKPVAGTALESGGVATLWLTRQPPARTVDTTLQ